jgi:HD superfamily phosphohydrolase
LHDIPHTAFSHVADVVFPNATHTFHEKFEEKIILSSEIPFILSKYKMSIKKILNKNNFHLLEAELPDLSADRIDYFLRDTRIDPVFPDSLVTIFLKDLSVRDSKFYFKTKSLAILYCILFMDAGKLLWLDANSHGSHELLGETLKRALKIKLITIDDLFKTDDEVLKILRKSKDKVIKQYLTELSPQKDFVYASKAEARFWGPNKPRFVDPFVDIEGKLIRVSKLFSELSKMFEDFKNTYQFIGVK